MLLRTAKKKLLHTGIRSASRLAPNVTSNLLWRLFCTPLVASKPTPSQAAQLARAERLEVPFGHKKLTVYRWPGNGPVLLAVHGWGGRAHVFGDLIPRLCEHFTVISFDAPGHGRLGQRTNMMEYSSAIRAVCRNAGPVKALLGHSFGAFTAAYTASKLPDLEALALVGAPDRLEYMLDYAQKALSAPDHIRRHLEKRIEKLSGEPVTEHSTTAYLQRVDCSILFVHDHDDREVPVVRAKSMAARTNAELLLTKGYGHHRILTAQEVAEGLSDFFCRQVRPFRQSTRRDNGD